MSGDEWLMDAAQAAARLRVTPRWLAEQACAGKIPSRKVGRARRYLQADLDDYLERVRQGQADGFAMSPRSRSRRRAS